MSGSSGTQIVNRNRVSSQANVVVPVISSQNLVNGSTSNPASTSRRNATIALARRKRKFPGPAGLLPDLEPEVISNLNILGNNPISQTVAEIIMTDKELQNHMKRSRDRESDRFNLNSSQNDKDHSLLSKHPWRELLQQLELTPEFPNNLLEFMNINWVLTTASQLIHCQKLPFLTVALKEAPELPTSKLGEKKTPCVKLVDATGTIEAALDPAFVKMNGPYLQPGTALSLKNVGLLRHKRRIILTISSKNVIYMASKGSEVESPLSSQPSETEREENVNSFNGNQPVTVNDDSQHLKHRKPKEVVTTENGVKIFKFSDYSSDRIMDAFKSLTDPRVIRQQYEQLQQDTESLNDDDDGDLQGNSRISDGNNDSSASATNNRRNTYFGNNNHATFGNRRQPQLFTHVSSSSASLSASVSTSRPLFLSSNNAGKDGQGRSTINDNQNEFHDSEALSNFSFNFEDDDEDDEFFRAFDLEVQELSSPSQNNQSIPVTGTPPVQSQNQCQRSENENSSVRNNEGQNYEESEDVSRASTRVSSTASPSSNLNNSEVRTNFDSGNDGGCGYTANDNDFDDFEDEFDKELAAFDETINPSFTEGFNSNSNNSVNVPSESQTELNVEDVGINTNTNTNSPVEDGDDDDNFFEEFDMELDAM